MKLLLNVVGILFVLAISWLIAWDRKRCVCKRTKVIDIK